MHRRKPTSCGAYGSHGVGPVWQCGDRGADQRQQAHEKQQAPDRREAIFEYHCPSIDNNEGQRNGDPYSNEQAFDRRMPDQAAPAVDQHRHRHADYRARQYQRQPVGDAKPPADLIGAERSYQGQEERCQQRNEQRLALLSPVEGQRSRLFAKINRRLHLRFARCIFAPVSQTNGLPTQRCLRFGLGRDQSGPTASLNRNDC